MPVDLSNLEPGPRFIETLRRLSKNSGKFVGAQEISGRPANVFQVTAAAQDMILYTDPGTNLPLRVEIVRKPMTDIGCYDKLILKSESFQIFCHLFLF